LVQPFFIKKIIQSISGDVNEQDTDEALYWAVGLACTIILIANFHAHIFLNMELIGTDIKSATLSIIFKKVMIKNKLKIN